jgi:hypothetical protein
LSGVRVRAEPAPGSGRIGRAGRVDYRGRYRVADLAPGGWLLVATLDGGRRQVQARLVLASGTPEVTRDLRFEERFTLTGRVLRNGEPLPGTIVSLAGHQAAVERSVTTDFRGDFQVEDLAAGSYWVGLANSRYRLVNNREVEIDGDRTIVIDLRPARLSGAVVDATDGHGVEGALVVLRRQGDDGRPVSVRSRGSGPAGEFDFTNVSPGRYLLLVHEDGYAAEPRRLEVAEGVDVRDLELPVEPTRGVDLDVRLASGERPPFVTVVVVDAGGTPLLRQSRGVDPEGLVHLPTVPPGSWQLLVTAPGAAPTGVAVQVPGEPVPLRLDPAGTLDVQVPALGTSDLLAWLRLLGPDRRPFLGLDPESGITDSWRLVGGRVRVEGVPPGLWTLEVVAADGQSWWGSASSVAGAVVPVVLE